MRTGTILGAVEQVKIKRHGVKMRIITSGLLGPAEFGYDEVADANKDDVSQFAALLKSSKIKEISVFLPAADPDTYLAVMHPNGVPAALKPYHSLGAACNFISSCSEAGLTVSVSTIEKKPSPIKKGQFIDAKAVRELALALGAVDCVFKPYYP